MTYRIEQTTADPKSLKPNPHNPNRVDARNMEKLKRSIQDLGFYRPVVVRTLADKSLEILGGQHRTEAAIELGIKNIPIVNLGELSETKAKQIGLADNSQYGANDAIKLAKIYEELLVDCVVTDFLPIQEEDLQVTMRAVQVNLDDLEVQPDDTEDAPRDPVEREERPTRTHETLTFRVAVRDAESIRALIEKTIKRESLATADEMTAAGSALAFLLLGTP